MYETVVVTLFFISLLLLFVATTLVSKHKIRNSSLYLAGVVFFMLGVSSYFIL